MFINEHYHVRKIDKGPFFETKSEFEVIINNFYEWILEKKLFVPFGFVKNRVRTMTFYQIEQLLNHGYFYNILRMRKE